MEKEREIQVLLKQKKKKLKEIKSLLALTCGLSGVMFYMSELRTEAKESDAQFEVEPTDMTSNPIVEAQTLQNTLLNMRKDHDSILANYVKEISDIFGLSSDDMLNTIFDQADEISQSENQMEAIFQMIYQEKFKDVHLQGDIGYAWNEEEYQAFLQTYEGKLSYDAALSYGIDPHLMVALEKAESGLDHEHHLDPERNAAYGITQQERTNIRDGKFRQAKNFQTGKIDSIELTDANFRGLETNIKLGAMELRYALENGAFDISLALDIYNKGLTGAKNFRNGLEVSGNPNYVHDVLRYCTSPIITNQIDENTIMTTNLITGETFKYQVDLYDESKESGIETILSQYVRTYHELLELQNNMLEFGTTIPWLPLEEEKTLTK
ncbi:MAG: hypothetical protein KH135_00880 [Firmicutes bacterium]|nr:hypothetical protein [Bacillota bacterium]